MIATDTDFNNSSRYINVKLDIYFTSTPLTVTKSDHLMDADWLEEGSADSSNPFGVISSNELSFRLYNKDGMFNPTNVLGPYHGKIKDGVRVVLFIKPNEDTDWVKLGEYYVTGWEAQVTGIYADVVANDRWYTIFNKPMPVKPIMVNSTYGEVLAAYLGPDVDVDPTLTRVLPYGFVEGQFKEYLQKMSEAAMAYITSSKSGKPRVGAFTAAGPVRAILTDGDQVKSISTKQSIIRAYDGVELVYTNPQISDSRSLLDIKDAKGLTNLSISEGPLWSVTSVNAFTTDQSVVIKGITTSQWLVNIAMEGTGPYDVSMFGKTLIMSERTILDANASRPLKLTSRYIQDEIYANYYKSILKSFVTNASPLLNLTVRGNPLLNIGDKVTVQSVKYNITFTGIIQRMAYKYSGGLACDMTLLNTEVLQGVS